MKKVAAQMNSIFSFQKGKDDGCLLFPNPLWFMLHFALFSSMHDLGMIARAESTLTTLIFFRHLDSARRSRVIACFFLFNDLQKVCFRDLH